MGYLVWSDSRVSYDLLTCSNVDLMVQKPPQTSLPHGLLGGSPRTMRSVETSCTILADDADAVLFRTLGAARQGEQKGINGEPFPKTRLCERGYIEVVEDLLVRLTLLHSRYQV